MGLEAGSLVFCCQITSAPPSPRLARNRSTRPLLQQRERFAGSQRICKRDKRWRSTGQTRDWRNNASHPASSANTQLLILGRIEKQVPDAVILQNLGGLALPAVGSESDGPARLALPSHDSLLPFPIRAPWLHLGPRPASYPAFAAGQGRCGTLPRCATCQSPTGSVVGALVNSASRFVRQPARVQAPKRSWSRGCLNKTLVLAHSVVYSRACTDWKAGDDPLTATSRRACNYQRAPPHYAHSSNGALSPTRQRPI